MLQAIMQALSRPETGVAWVCTWVVHRCICALLMLALLPVVCLERPRMSTGEDGRCLHGAAGSLTLNTRLHMHGSTWAPCMALVLCIQALAFA